MCEGTVCLHALVTGHGSPPCLVLGQSRHPRPIRQQNLSICTMVGQTLLSCHVTCGVAHSAAISYNGTWSACKPSDGAKFGDKTHGGQSPPTCRVVGQRLPTSTLMGKDPPTCLVIGQSLPTCAMVGQSPSPCDVVGAESAHMHGSGGKCFCMHCVVAKSTSMLCGTAKAPHALWWGAIPLEAPCWRKRPKACGVGRGGGGGPPACPMVGQRPLPCLFAGHAMWWRKIMPNALQKGKVRPHAIWWAKICLHALWRGNVEVNVLWWGKVRGHAVC